MAIQAFRNTRFQGKTLARINQLESILTDYDGMRLTARQVYYQFVARDLLANTEKNYRLVTKLITDARYAGIVDWDQIEDRGRAPMAPSEFDNLEQLVNAALNSYRLPRWEGQDSYSELWVEKQALAGVLSPLASRFHVTLMVNKGYSSASAMKEAADRMRAAQGATGDDHRDWMAAINAQLAEVIEGSKQHDRIIKDGLKHIKSALKQVNLFYLGDHDPSGEDMVRDIEERLQEFGVHRLNVVKLGLTMEQIKKHKPPPNPAKITDSRAKAYIKKFGNQSWELDALPPRELQRIVEAAFNKVIDRKKMDAVIAREEKDRNTLRKAVKPKALRKKKRKTKRSKR